MDTMINMLGGVMVLMMLGLTISAQQICDQCNCHISSSKSDSQTIYNLGLICNSGTITWYGGSGGVLLELTPFIHGNFKACFVLDSDEHTFVKISQEKTHVPRLSNYRLRQQEIRKLRLHHLSTSNGRSREICVFSTRREPEVVYIEAMKTPGVGSVSKVLIHYDMEKKEPDSNHGVSNQLDECRPCTKEEILDAYCSMDFVTIGTISDVQDNLTTGKSEITMAIKQVIHTTHPGHFQRVKRSDPHLTGRVVTQRKCGVQKGGGDFLFIGRMRLGNLSLECAPYLHEWRLIQHEAECSHS